MEEYLNLPAKVDVIIGSTMLEDLECIVFLN
jgi:hypothetical protein